MPALITKKLSCQKGINLTPVWRARLLLLFLGLILLLPSFLFSGKVQKSPGTSSLEPIKIEETLLGQAKKGNPPTRVLFPSLKIDVPVRPARIVKGYWELFDDTAGFGLGSAYPGEVGNTVIFAHARPGLFENLREAKIGTIVYVFTADKWFRYEVKKVSEVLPSQIEVIAPTSDETLTLYTCSGFADQKRLILTAKRLL